MRFLIKVMALIVILVLIVFVVAAATLALGMALMCLFPLSLFQAALLLIASTGITVFTALTACIMHYTAEEEEFLCDDCRNNNLADTGDSRENIRRNDPCPCGSGKKFKNCCGD